MKNFIRKNRPLIAYIIIALIAAVIGIATAPGTELFYMILAQYLILPVAGFICSICSVKKGGVLGFLSPVIFIAISMLLPLAVMGTTDIVFLLFSGIPCALGAFFGLIGYAVSASRKNDSEEKNEAKEEKREAREEKKQDKEEAKNEDEEFSVESDDANSSEANAAEDEEDEEPAELIAD